MRPDLETLRAYADGELAPVQQQEVAAALAADAELAHTARALSASRLAYQQAYASVPVPPVPAALHAHLAGLLPAAVATESLAWAGPAHAPRQAPRDGSRWKAPALLWFGLLIVCLAALVIAALQRPAAEPWLRSVMSYHAMYSRDTVTDSGPETGPAQLQALRQVLQAQLGLDLRAPDLSPQGLQFVRAQRLQFEGKLVLQLIYLPRQGEPVALCLMQAASQPERALTSGAQHALAWHRGGWAYVLVGTMAPEQLQALRQQLGSSII
jgi:anti-sigma factor RsiW